MTHQFLLPYAEELTTNSISSGIIKWKKLPQNQMGPFSLLSQQLSPAIRALLERTQSNKKVARSPPLSFLLFRESNASGFTVGSSILTAGVIYFGCARIAGLHAETASTISKNLALLSKRDTSILCSSTTCSGTGHARGKLVTEAKVLPKPGSHLIHQMGNSQTRSPARRKAHFITS